MSRNDDFAGGVDPLAEAAAGAQHYQRQHGIYVPDTDYSRVAMSAPAQRRIADAYDALPDFDPKAVPAYHQMAEETGRQFDYLTKPKSKGGLGVNVEATAEDPYGKNDAYDIMGEIRGDLRDNNRLKVFSSASTGGHPAFTNDQNDMFRAVHDYFGHLGSGRGVDKHGEEAAFQKHSRMYSPLARQAMATETRGQNASFYKHGEFPAQKVALLPSHIQSLQFNNVGSPEDRDFASNEAQQKSRQQGLA